MRTQESASVKENIGALYGASVSRCVCVRACVRVCVCVCVCDAMINHVSPWGTLLHRELLPISSQNPKLGFGLEGFVTNANYSQKKFEFLLFINRMMTLG